MIPLNAFALENIFWTTGQTWLGNGIYGRGIWEFLSAVATLFICLWKGFVLFCLSFLFLCFLNFWLLSTIAWCAQADREVSGGLLNPRALWAPSLEPQRVKSLSKAFPGTRGTLHTSLAFSSGWHHRQQVGILPSARDVAGKQLV